ncbi:MAG: Uma2 family endonuclease [Limnoraphis robusta]|jgi:Uma2 family endonuclease
MNKETSTRYYTPEDYLKLEETAEYKNEYRDGEIIPMAGGTTNHNEIALNFCTDFKVTLRGQGYKIYMGDVRLWIPQYRIYTYPDMMVIQGTPIYAGTGTTTVTNPLMIVEVLSKSTKDYDCTDKFRYYRSLPEFTEYVLIDQYEPYIEQYTKTAENKWLFTVYDSSEATLSLNSINFQISLETIYDGIDWNSDEQ